MPIRTPISTDVYGGFRRNETSIGEVLGAIQGIQGMVQNSRMMRKEEELKEDDKFLNDLYAQNFAGWDGRDPAEFQRRKRAVDLEVQKTKPSLFGKALGYSKTLEDAMYGRLGKDIDLDTAVLNNEKTETDLYKSRLDFNRDFLKDLKYKQDIVGKQFALVAEGKQGYDDAVHKIKSLGVNAKLPTKEEFNQNPLRFYDYLVAQDMKTTEELAALELKEKNIGVQKSEKELEWYDRLQRATINQKNRTGTGGGLGDLGGGGGLTYQDRINATVLANKIGGGSRGGKRILPFILEGLKNGKTIDEMGDLARFSQQSEDFSGPARSAMQRLYSGKSEKVAGFAFEAFDDVLSSGDPEEVASFLKDEAIKSAPAALGTQMFGKDRTVEFIKEIQSDLTEFEAKGGNTGIFNGTLEGIARKIGRVNNPELRKIANKIRLGLIKYRKDMSGVAFGKEEGKEYKGVFPSIDYTKDLNTSTINALLESFGGDLEHFYRRKLGDKAYETLISGNPISGGGGGSGNGGTGDEFDELWKTYGGK